MFVMAAIADGAIAASATNSKQSVANFFIISYLSPSLFGTQARPLKHSIGSATAMLLLLRMHVNRKVLNVVNMALERFDEYFVRSGGLPPAPP
jgi:uncharacterized membrane protein